MHPTPPLLLSFMLHKIFLSISTTDSAAFKYLRAVRFTLVPHACVCATVETVLETKRYSLVQHFRCAPFAQYFIGVLTGKTFFLKAPASLGKTIIAKLNKKLKS